MSQSSKALKAINKLSRIVGDDEGLSDMGKDRLFIHLHALEVELVPPCECSLDHFHTANKQGCIMRGCACMRPGD